MPKLTISVRDLLTLRFGPRDISRAYVHPLRLQQGIQGHSAVTATRPAEYKREVSVFYDWQSENWQLTVRGRIDGYQDTGDYILVEEIKTTWLPPERLDPQHNQFYLAQLGVYAWIVQDQSPGRTIRARLTWWHLEQEEERSIDLTAEQIANSGKLLAELVRDYINQEQRQQQWLAGRNASLRTLAFPFASYRPGQQELVATTQLALEQDQDLMVEAATGIGKTAAILYPALQWLATAPPEAKLFFLTAKTSGRAIVEETLHRLPGLKLRAVFIEAKERSCRHPEGDCDTCELGRDFYPRATKLLPGLLNRQILSVDLIREQADTAKLCPFELGLEAASLADLVVADYNYVFDPLVQLKRFFGPGQNVPAALLVDEAHNLVSRGREMFSATLAKKQILDLQRALKTENPQLADQFGDLNKSFIQWNKELKAQGGGMLLLDKLPWGMRAKLERMSETIALMESESVELADFSKRLLRFNRICQHLSPEHAVYVSRQGGDTLLQIFCLNPGPLLKQQRGQNRAIFFSATLNPGPYYRELLGCREQYLDVNLPSPFPRENRLYAHIPGIQTRFVVRDRYYPAVARNIARVVSFNPGNYIAYFPSYTYLQAVAAYLPEYLPSGFKLHCQQAGMDIAARQELLAALTGAGANLGMAVMGGLFGEGVDMPGEQLIGTIIVGPGLPMVSAQQQLIRDYFDQSEEGSGFLYAYLIPGLLRVIQSAGRVLRTPEDRGIVVLMDDRFRSEGYRQLLPESWLAEGLFASAWPSRIEEFWSR
ncbi:MAG: DEAD/DEAH box helicase [Firmicutes bacterium]|nr:DEAD/DEAH box helicase [Bacillota bacterium]